MKKPRIALAFAFLFLIALRVVLKSSNELTIIVALINIAALFVVLYDVAEKLKKSVLEKIECTVESKRIARREKKQFSTWLYIVLVSTSLLFVFLYLKYWCCSLGNDSISIVALAISILGDEIVSFGTFLYKV